MHRTSIPKTLRITNRGRDQLIQIKRKTGIDHWNIICRWALVQSLKEQTVPPKLDESGESTVEMSWDVFSGGTGVVYWEILVQWTLEMGLDPNVEPMTDLFRRHIHRGISAIAGRPEYATTMKMVEKIAGQ